MDERPRLRFSLASLLVFMFLLAALAALFVPAYNHSRRLSLKADCRNSLRQLGNYLTLYVCRPGTGDRYYASCAPPGGSGAPVPAGTNGAFWSRLYRVPNQTNAVSQRPGDDALYVCRLSLGGGVVSTTALEYSAPNFAAMWPAGLGTGEIYPNDHLSEACRVDAPVGGDLIGPDRPNHGGRPGVPNDDWSMLCFDGHVATVAPGTAKHLLYVTATVGLRTT